MSKKSKEPPNESRQPDSHQPIKEGSAESRSWSQKLALYMMGVLPLPKWTFSDKLQLHLMGLLSLPSQPDRHKMVSSKGGRAIKKQVGLQFWLYERRRDKGADLDVDEEWRRVQDGLPPLEVHDQKGSRLARYEFKYDKNDGLTSSVTILPDSPDSLTKKQGRTVRRGALRNYIREENQGLVKPIIQLAKSSEALRFRFLGK